MASLGFGVRLFEMQSDGALEPLLGVDEDYFRGTVPNVGDTFAMWGLHDVYRFYSIQRRYFIDSPDGDRGWCIIVREIDSAPPLENVVKTWVDDTKFWREVDEQEHQEEVEKQERLRKQEEDRQKNAPRHSLHPREVRALRFMIEHPESNTIDVIPQAGEHTLNVLSTAGLIRSAGKDHRGLKTWRVTKEGRAEIERHDKWANWQNS